MISSAFALAGHYDEELLDLIGDQVKDIGLGVDMWGQGHTRTCLFVSVMGSARTAKEAPPRGAFIRVITFPSHLLAQASRHIDTIQSMQTLINVLGAFMDLQHEHRRAFGVENPYSVICRQLPVVLRIFF